MIKQRYIKRCHKRGNTFVQSNYNIIRVEGGDGPLNFQCHRNALHRHNKEGQKVVACYARNGDYYEAHFINKVGDRYIDNSAGLTGYYTEYRLVLEYDSFRHKNPDKELAYLKKFYLDAVGIPFISLLLGIDEIN